MGILSSLSGLKQIANPWLLLAVLLMVVGAGFTGLRYGVQYEKGRAAQNAVLIQQAADAAQKAAAGEIAKIKVIHQTNQTRLEREIVKVPDFSQCHTGADALGVLNAALTNKAGPQPTGDRLVPDADGDHR